MGLALWLFSGLAAFATARIIPLIRGRGWIGELLLAAATAALFGVTATALDFGGWTEGDWRAGLFSFFGAFAAIGVFRLTAIRRRR